MGALLLRAQEYLIIVLDWFDGASHRLFVSHHGAYSIERLYALESYCSRTSKLRVATVCLLLSLPPLLVPIILELIPLQNPSDGWRANYGCWIRIFFSSCAVGLGVILQIDALIPDLKLTRWAFARVCVATSSVFTAVLLAVAALWAFPTPFSIVIGSIPWPLSLTAILVATVGVKRLQSDRTLRREILQQIYIIGVQVSLVVVYSVFNVVYSRLPPDHKAFLVLVLPIVKLAMQHAIAWSMKDLEEYQPGIVVFCIGVFNGLYMSKCMQNSGSRLTYMVIIALDTLQGILAFRRLRKTMKHIQTLAKACEQSGMFNANLLEATVQISQEPGVLLHREGKLLIRIRSPIKPHLPHQSTTKLNQLANYQIQQIAAPRALTGSGLIPFRFGYRKIWPANSARTVKNYISKPLTITFTSRSSQHRPAVCVQPIEDNNGELIQPAEDPLLIALSPTRLAQKHDIVSSALKLLFECEFHVLVEYVESLIPMMYAIYVAIMSRLPSAEYYPETRGKSPVEIDTMVVNILAYALMEAFSFLVMHLSFKWKSSLSPVTILAFVIENQTQELLGRLFVWYVFLLQFTLAHYGK